MFTTPTTDGAVVSWGVSDVENFCSITNISFAIQIEGTETVLEDLVVATETSSISYTIVGLPRISVIKYSARWIREFDTVGKEVIGSHLKRSMVAALS